MGKTVELASRQLIIRLAFLEFAVRALEPTATLRPLGILFTDRSAEAEQMTQMLKNGMQVSFVEKVLVDPTMLSHVTLILKNEY